MAQNNALPLVAGGLAVVVLSFGAGLLGGSMAEPPAPASEPAATTTDSATRAHIDEIDRRLVNVEERMRIIEETANSALQRAQQIDGLRRDVEALKSGGAGSAMAAEAPERDVIDPVEQPSLTAEERRERDADRAERLRKSMLKIAKRNGPMLLKNQLARIADGTDQGAKDRFSQVVSQAKQMATLYQLSSADEDTVRDILKDEMAASVRDVAPYLASGIEKADYSQVKPKITAIWEQRDARMKDVLDEEQFEAYSDNQKQWRKIFTDTFDAMDRERLAQR